MISIPPATCLSSILVLRSIGEGGSGLSITVHQRPSPAPLSRRSLLAEPEALRSHPFPSVTIRKKGKFPCPKKKNPSNR